MHAIILIALTFLPNSTATPGATDPRVTQANIHQTICRPGYTKTVRPSAEFTDKLKKQMLASGAYEDHYHRPAFYELDHLIPLELGGNPSDAKNLWPQIWNGAQGAHVKDECEDRTHKAVCAGQLSLQAAQEGMAKDWIKFCGVR